MSALSLTGWLRAGRRSQPSLRAVAIASNLVGAAGAVYFADVSLRFYLHTHRPIGAVYFAEQMWVVIAYLIRRPARATSRKTADWLLAFGGTFGGVLLRPDGAHLRWALDAGLGVQLAGLALCIASFLALGRSFGFAAADRGLVERGPYAVVRHPIYASYLLLQLGYLLQSLSLRNAVVVVVVTACNVGRIHAEERVLAGNDRHHAYRGRVRWRLVPTLW